MRFSTLASAAALFELSIAGYVLEDDYMDDFFGGFNFFTGKDPTEGFVDYVDEATARQTNLINASSTSVVQWGVDVENQTPNGRPSVRIESKKQYDSGLIVIDVAHMPFGCGTWPAFWTVGPNWPKNGEIDIIEGVNEQTNNGMTLHTGPGCQIGQDTAQFYGKVSSDNCDVAAYDQPTNTGCSIEHPSTKSYGGGLNANGGGVYATQWTSEAISIYFFPRGSVPADVLGDNPDPSGWGTPAARFTGGCDIAETFKKQQLVFDTTFCGVWAGSEQVWNSGSCGKKAATCEEWVRDNPEAFKDAYWTINALKVYQDNGDAPVPKPSAKPSKTAANTKPLFAPTVTASFPAIAPPLSSAFVYPTNIAVPPAPIEIPGGSDGVFAPISSALPLPEVPGDGTPSKLPPQAPSQTRSAAKRPKPTQPIANQPPASVGVNGMPGFQWPNKAGGQLDESSPTTSAPSAPKVTPTPVESPAPAPTDTDDADPSIPIVPVVTDTPNAVQTVYETVYATVTDAAPPSVPVVTETTPAVQTVYETVYATLTVDPAPTPVPGANKARQARHVRAHRQRLTRHNAVRM